MYPNGHFVRVLGRIGDLEGEIATILVENSILVAPFSEAQVRFPRELWSGERKVFCIFSFCLLWYVSSLRQKTKNLCTMSQPTV